MTTDLKDLYSPLLMEDEDGIDVPDTEEEPEKEGGKEVAGDEDEDEDEKEKEEEDTVEEEEDEVL